jgi:LysR family glycine cleavage system transcriptional activator
MRPLAEWMVDTPGNPKVSRRLAAILAADIAGYSSLMGTDEGATVRDLKGHQAVILPMIGKHGGRVIDTAGDGILAEFGSVVNAVECAIAIQKAMAERNAQVEEARRMQFRIGVNQGDVIHDKTRVYGDGVNVAARLESIAEPGGICISAKVHDEIAGKMNIACQDFGTHQLKNIMQPVHVYRIKLLQKTRAMHKLPPLIELRAFDAAAHHLSFRKAAVELGVTPTAISHQIRLLERYCGRALFRRRPRPLSLTEAGARLYPVICDGLEAFATAMAAIRREENKQPLRVTTTNAFASRWLVSRLHRWRKARPDAPLEVIGTDGVLDLQAGDADVAIRYARSSPTDGIAEEFLTDAFWPICNPELLSAGGLLKKAADLRRHVLVHCYWSPSDLNAPTWQRWLTLARRK